MRFFCLWLAAAVVPCGAARGAGVWRACATPAHDRIVISNGTEATGANISCRWKVLRNGIPVAVGAFPTKGLKPGRAFTLAVPPILRENAAKGGEMSLRVTFSRWDRKEDDEPVKTPFATYQIDFADTKPETLPAAPGGPQPEGAGDLVLRTDRQTYTFDRATGQLKQLATGGLFGRTGLASPVLPVFDLPRTPEVLAISGPTTGADGTSLTSAVRWHAADGSNDVDVVTRWTVRNDGLALCASEVRAADPDEVYDGPFGCRFALRDEALLQYYGKGRGDKEPVAVEDLLGRWTVTREDGAAPTGMCAAVRALALDLGAQHVSVVATEKPFDVDYCLGSQSVLVVKASRERGVPAAERVTRLAFALWPEKRLSAVSVPPVDLPPPVEKGVSAEGKLPFVKFHELPKTVVAKGLRLRMVKGGAGRQECRPNEGRVKGFTFEASEDGKRWTRLLEGELADRPGWQQIDFTQPATMRWWRFEAVNGQAGAQEAAVAEIKVTE